VASPASAFAAAAPHAPSTEHDCQPGIGQQAVVANRTPDLRFRDDPKHVLIEDYDTFLLQVFQKGDLVGKVLTANLDGVEVIAPIRAPVSSTVT